MQQHTAKYQVPTHLISRPDDGLEARYQKEMGLDAHIAQTKNLIERKHRVIVPGHDETPAWLTKRGHAETLHHIHEMLDRATELGVNGFHAHHQRNHDPDSPHYGKVTRLSSPKPLTITFARVTDEDGGKLLGAYHYEDHAIHLMDPREHETHPPLNNFADYERRMLVINSNQKNWYKRNPRSRGKFAVPEGTFAHELGHAMYSIYANATNKQLGRDVGYWGSFNPHEQVKIRNAVSRYGATEPAEFAAEVFSRHLHGYPVPPQMNTLYEVVNGHPLRTERIPTPVWNF